MTDPKAIDGVLVQWGDRHFFPGNRMVRGATTPRLSALLLRQRANAVRARIAATVARRAPQVMVKVTGGGRGMKAIAAHFKYISKNGRLDIEDDRGDLLKGRSDLRELVEEWQLGGTAIDDIGYRREAFNVMLSMPRGVDALYVLKAAREFARAEFGDHKYVMVLHDHQANPHVHLSVRAESMSGKRLNPRKTDLHRWRETFADKLRGWGIEAEATRQATRGENRNFDPLWRLKAKQEGRLRQTGLATKAGQRHWDSRADAVKGWAHIIKALAASESPDDRKLAERVVNFVRGSPFVLEQMHQRQRRAAVAPRQQQSPQPQRRTANNWPGPELGR